jgi:HEAT repeat protein
MRGVLLLGLIGALALAGGCRKPGPALAHGRPVAEWVEVLRDPDARARKKAVGVLGNVGPVEPAVVPALAGAVRDRDAAVRAEAALALMKIGPAAREAESALTEAQNDQDPAVRRLAAKALERVRGK